MPLQDSMTVVDIEPTLEWLVRALEQTRSTGQAKLVGYLEEVADEVVFEVEFAARRNTCI